MRVPNLRLEYVGHRHEEELYKRDRLACHCTSAGGDPTIPEVASGNRSPVPFFFLRAWLLNPSHLPRLHRASITGSVRVDS